MDRTATLSLHDGGSFERVAYVHLASFEGPLALMVTLIEKQRLDILEVPLGDLAGAYLEAVAHLRGDQLPNLSSFVAVSSQLILIKSRALLPRPQLAGDPEADEDGDPEAELRARLILYRRYRDAGERLSERRASGMSLVHREAAIAQAAGRAGADSSIADRLDPAILRDALVIPMATTDPTPAPPGLAAREITLEERVSVIRRALRRAPVVVLQDLLRDVRDRVVVAVTFLAMLELVKQREMTVEQDEPWGPIICRALPAPAPTRG